MPKKSKIVFIVDDDTTMQKITKRLLTRNGYTTVACLYGEECINRAKMEHPDIILMDVMLPDGDGREFVKRLREDERTKDIPIIFTTSMVDLEDDKGYEVFNIDGVLYRAFAKPLHSQKIISVIQKEINRKKFDGALPKGIHEYQRNRNDIMGKYILVVDDEPEVLKILNSQLNKEEYKVKCVSTGNEATKVFVESYYDQPFDVILLDIDLPDINGCDVLKEIRQEEEIRGLKYDEGVKIIMQTGLKESWMDAFNLGCDDYIVKPYTFEDLLKKIKEKTGEIQAED